MVWIRSCQVNELLVVAVDICSLIIMLYLPGKREVMVI